MKRFKLSEDGFDFVMEGDTLKKAFADIGQKVPEAWKKVKGVNITKELEERAELLSLRKEYADLLEDKDVIKERIKELKKLKKPKGETDV